MTVTLPVALPVAAGANFTLKLTLCPLFSVTGKVNPLMLKPVPDAAAAVIFRLDPPEFVKVSVMVWLFPTDHASEVQEEGLADSAPSAAPLPLNGIFNVGFDPSDVIVTFPVALPAAVGANFALKLHSSGVQRDWQRQAAKAEPASRCARPGDLQARSARVGQGFGNSLITSDNDRAEID